MASSPDSARPDPLDWLRKYNTAAYLRPWAPKPDLLRVCGTCFCHYGGEVPMDNLCPCAPKSEREELAARCKARNGDHWDTPADLCRCCGAEVLQTPVKYATWFCRSCLTRARAVNEALGCCAIPVGWHSLVNGVFIHPNRCKTLPGASIEMDQLKAFFRESGSVWTRGLQVVERQWDRAGLPRGSAVSSREYLDAVWRTPVDKAALFEELLVDRHIPHDWRDYAAVPLRLIWTKAPDERRYEASDWIVWTYPDGDDEYADLTLTVAETGKDSWDWTLSVDQEAAGTSDPVIGRGAAGSLEAAKDDCERAASRLIEQREREAGG